MLASGRSCSMGVAYSAAYVGVGLMAGDVIVMLPSAEDDAALTSRYDGSPSKVA
jgi:hypothetical protein